MNAIEEAKRLQDLFVLFGIPARSVRGMNQMSDEDLYRLFEITTSKLRAYQGHSDVELIREYFTDVTDVCKVRGSKRALQNLMAKRK